MVFGYWSMTNGKITETTGTLDAFNCRFSVDDDNTAPLAVPKDYITEA